MPKAMPNLVGMTASPRFIQRLVLKEEGRESRGRGRGGEVKGREGEGKGKGREGEGEGKGREGEGKGKGQSQQWQNFNFH